MLAHAKLSASGSHVWLACPAAPALSKNVVDNGSKFAEEGTLAHELRELALRERLLGETVTYPVGRYPEDMFAHIAESRSRIEALIAEVGETPIVWLEERLDLTDWVPEGFGTGDLSLVFPKAKLLVVDDFKYGAGVAVSPVENSQLMLYGGGVARIAELLCDIDTVRLRIDQPRRGNWATWDLPLAELHERLAAMRPIAHRAWALLQGEPITEQDVVPGEHCVKGFCKFRDQCSARTKAMLQVFDDNHDEAPGAMSPERIAELLPSLPLVEAWAKGLQAHAAKLAIADGVKIPGYKVVEGRSFRRYSNTETVLRRLTDHGFKWAQTLKERELVSLGEMEKVVGGKKAFDELLGDLLDKPPGKPTLVPIGDKRPEMHGSAALSAVFDD